MLLAAAVGASLATAQRPAPKAAAQSPQFQSQSHSQSQPKEAESPLKGDSRGSVAPAARVLSPDVASDRRVTFRLLAPDAREVMLTGEFLHDARRLEKDGHGVWSVTVGPLEPEIYNYNFSIDGVRTIDPGNAAVKTGSTPTTISSMLEVHGDQPAFYDPQPVSHGDIHSHVYSSRSLGSERRLTVYTPPEYLLDATRRYPVVYLLHGANADETAWYRLGRINFILDNLRARALVKPFIVAMPFGYGVPPGAAWEPGENTARFATDLVGDIIPFVESRYRTIADRDHRAIIGLSMGGGQALCIGLNHLELFSHVAGFSAGVGPARDFSRTFASLLAHPQLAVHQLRLLWVGCGRDDGAFAASRDFSSFLNEHAIAHTFRVSEGAHTWMVWRRYMSEVSPLLFQQGME